VLCKLNSAGLNVRPHNAYSLLLYVADSAVSRNLCRTVSELLAKIASENCRDENVEGSVSAKCLILKQKLDALLTALNDEAASSTAASTVKSSWNFDRIENRQEFIYE